MQMNFLHIVDITELHYCAKKGLCTFMRTFYCLNADEKWSKCKKNKLSRTQIGAKKVIKIARMLNIGILKDS